MPTLIRVYITGVLMGMADLVPGVSGGTIAFLSGFYPRLINALAQIGPTLVAFIKKPRIVEAWLRVDGNFLLLLLGGIITCVLLLPGVIEAMLENHPGLAWSFFFGLIIGSIVVIGTPLPKNAKTLMAFIVGLGIGLLIALVLPSQRESIGMVELFFGGALAICAMILPGISGSYILLLLGFYAPIIALLHERNWGAMAIIALGCLSGLILFSQLLQWLLKNQRAITLALMLGIMAGGLLKLWPYNASDTVKASPLTMVLCGLCGAVVVLVIERLGKDSEARTSA